MTKTQHWERIPIELRLRPQWCYTFPGDPDPGRVKAPRKAGNVLASDVVPTDWMTFNDACLEAIKVGGDIGYILSSNDDYACIDLDVKDVSTDPLKPENWTTKEDFDRYWRICQTFNSYTELSRSGKGLHIWVKGNIGKGCRRDGVEVYSQERFIICTGQIVLNRPIVAHQDLLNQMVRDMRSVQLSANYELEEVAEEHSDEEILRMASEATNGDKFNELCSCTATRIVGKDKIPGSFTQLGYPSQSEADLALMSILAFYSKSNEQCRRLFRYSGLGQRPKAQNDDRYLNRTLQIIRSRQMQTEVVETESLSMAAELMVQVQKDRKERESQLLHVTGRGEPAPTVAPAAATVAALAPVTAPQGSDSGVPWPPGLAGQMARYIYESAPRPVKEVAIVATLGLLAGICGKAFSIPRSGLNLYIVLIARSAIGKEGMHSGVSSLMAEVATRQPAAMRFVEFSDFASGPALKKAVAANTSFVNVAGEWGHKLKRLAIEDGRDSPMSQLRTVMTDLYQKSGPASIVGGISYSNRDSNIASVSGVAYSMIGESTPGKFYDSLTESMMEDGFLSRFVLIEYTGERPPLNKNPLLEPSKSLGDAIAELCTHAMTMIDRQTSCPVGRTDAAAAIMEAFELKCDAQINSTDNEMWRQMWNRASLKSMRIAALLAVSDNWINPIIQEHHVEWAIDLIMRDIGVMSRRIEGGDIGVNDDSRERKIVQILREYLEEAPSPTYGIPEPMRIAGVIPRKFLQQRTSRLSAFAGHRAGFVAALDITLKSMCDNGYLVEVDKGKLMEGYRFTGRAFRIIQLPTYTGF